MNGPSQYKMTFGKGTKGVIIKGALLYEYVPNLSTLHWTSMYMFQDLHTPHPYNSVTHTHTHTPPPAMVALMSVSNSSSPLMAS